VLVSVYYLKSVTLLPVLRLKRVLRYILVVNQIQDIMSLMYCLLVYTLAVYSFVNGAGVHQGRASCSGPRGVPTDVEVTFSSPYHSPPTVYAAVSREWNLRIMELVRASSEIPIGDTIQKVSSSSFTLRCYHVFDDAEMNDYDVTWISFPRM